MMGWFMIDNIIEISSSIDVIIYDYYIKISHVMGSVEVYDNEIDDLIAALQKAKAIMASDKSK